MFFGFLHFLKAYLNGNQFSWTKNAPAMWRRIPSASRLEEPGHSWAKKQSGQIKTIQRIKSAFWSQEQNMIQNTGFLELPKYPFIFLVRIWWKIAQRLFLWMDERSVAFQLFFAQEGWNSITLLYILNSKHILNPWGILIFLHIIILCLRSSTQIKGYIYRKRL